MFGDGSTLNNALMSAIATANFSDLFTAAAAGIGAGAAAVPPSPLVYSTSVSSSITALSSPMVSTRSLSSAKHIFEQLARRQEQQQQQQQKQYNLHKQQQQQQRFRSETIDNDQQNSMQEQYQQQQRSHQQPRQSRDASNEKRTEFLLSPPPSYGETLTMNALARPMSSAAISAAMSPDILRLAADTTAVTLRDENDDATSAFVRPVSTSLSSVNGSAGVESAAENTFVQAQPSTNINHDEPLDLSVRRNQNASARNLIGPCASSPSPSNSSISSFDSTSNASTPSKSSLMHNYGNRVGEVKRSASSVTYRNTSHANFDADVAEHFRRSLSGKWPRRQLNYAHYISPATASGGGAKSLNASSCSLATNAAAGMSVSAARLPDRFPSINELRATTMSPTSTGGAGESRDTGASSLQKIFAEKFENNVFARKNSLTARYMPQKVTQNLSGLAPSSKIIWRKKSSASCHSAATSDYGGSASGMATPCASPYAGSSVSGACSSGETTAAAASPRLSAGYSASTSSGIKKSASKNSIIIINQAQDVEDHFRMALGDKTFQQLKRVQNRPPKIRQNPYASSLGSGDNNIEDLSSTTAVTVENSFLFTSNGRTPSSELISAGATDSSIRSARL